MYRSAMFLSILILTACSAPSLPFAQLSPTATKPQVIVTAPVSGASFTAGAEVVVQSTSSDTSGIVRVELLVDGQVVRSDAALTGKNQLQFQVVQTWKATPGAHTIIVRATNENGATSEAALSLTVTEPPKPTNTPVPTVAPTSVPTATSAPVPTKAATPTAPPTAAPTVTQYALTVNEEQFNTIVNDAMRLSQVQYVSNASVKLQNGQIAITATFTPPFLKPSTANAVLAASVSSCDLRVSVVAATLGLFTPTDEQKAALGQSIERLLKSQVTQQRQSTCVDSVSVAGGVMTIKYH